MTKATSQHYGSTSKSSATLKGVKHLKLTWCARSVKAPFQRGQIFGFADASWSDDKSSRRSTLCCVLCCNGVAFSWKSALDPFLALSTSEAELISVASCAQEVNFCRKLGVVFDFIVALLLLCNLLRFNELIFGLEILQLLRGYEP